MRSDQSRLYAHRLLMLFSVLRNQVIFQLANSEILYECDFPIQSHNPHFAFVLIGQKRARLFTWLFYHWLIVIDSVDSEILQQIVFMIVILMIIDVLTY